jgi:hypothetical protein
MAPQCIIGSRGPAPEPRPARVVVRDAGVAADERGLLHAQGLPVLGDQPRNCATRAGSEQRLASTDSGSPRNAQPWEREPQTKARL